MRRTLITSTTLAAALLLGACGGGDGETAATPDTEAAAAPAGGVTVVATEFAFEPEDFRLPADTDVELTLDNTGVVEHDIVVEDLGDRELVYADASTSATETVNLPGGTYTYYCSIPGHRQAGMEGTLTVG
jgi:plastocyanin